MSTHLDFDTSIRGHAIMQAAQELSRLLGTPVPDYLTQVEDSVYAWLAAVKRMAEDAKLSPFGSCIG